LRPIHVEEIHFLNPQSQSKDPEVPYTWSLAKGSKTVRKVQIKEFRMTVFYVIVNAKTVHVLEYAGPGLQPRWSERL
jgi:hypothetical protein